MADVDIDPFVEHESRPEEPTDEHIPLIPGEEEYKLGTLDQGRGPWASLCGVQSMNKKHHLQMKGRKNL